ncbi:MAG: hypothetical protein HQK83_20445, partial [Fibrobacteria bacterium]|nr:hypothetical protein [Fibrobacteria bacterium]
MGHIWRKLSVSIIFLVFGFSLLFAGVPTAKMMMLDLDHMDRVSSKVPADDRVLTFEELSDAGINTILPRTTNGVGKAYTMWELVNEAHEYGFWVIGATLTQNGNANCKLYASQMAAAGVDMIQLDEPLLGWGSNCVSRALATYGENFTETEYASLKASVHVIDNSIPVIITDVDCIEKVFTKWSNLDGLFNELYFDQWYSLYYPKMLTHKQAHPNQIVGNWVWLLTYGDNYLGATTIISDAQFENWTSTNYNGPLGHTWFFIFNRRAKGTDNAGSNGADWGNRAAIIKRVSGGGKAFSEWQQFAQTGEPGGAMDVSVKVRHDKYGLDTSSVQVFYAVEENEYGNTKWVRHYGLSMEAPSGEKDWITITARRVSFDTVGTGTAYKGPRVRFKIKDKYDGQGLRNARYLKKDYPVTANGIGWSDFSGMVIPKTHNPDYVVSVQNSIGLEPSTVLCEYSVDGGKSWKEHPVECSGASGSKEKETITVKNVPFTSGSEGQTQMRFSINTTANKTSNSPEYPVRVNLPPEIKDLKLTRSGDKVNMSLTLHDEDGLRVGSGPAATDITTLALYPMDGNGIDISGHGRLSQFKNGAMSMEMDSWKSAGGKEKTACFDGSGDYMDMGDFPLGPT